MRYINTYILRTLDINNKKHKSIRPYFKKKQPFPCANASCCNYLLCLSIKNASIAKNAATRLTGGKWHL